MYPFVNTTARLCYLFIVDTYDPCSRAVQEIIATAYINIIFLIYPAYISTYNVILYRQSKINFRQVVLVGFMSYFPNANYMLHAYNVCNILIYYNLY